MSCWLGFHPLARAWNTFRKRVLTGIPCFGVIFEGQLSAPAPICESYHQQTSVTTASGGSRLLGHFLVGRAMPLSTRTIERPLRSFPACTLLPACGALQNVQRATQPRLVLIRI